MDKQEKKECIFSKISLVDDKGQGLKGVSKYDQAFLEELFINHVKNTKQALDTIKAFAVEKQLNYKIMLVGSKLEDQKIIYEKV